MPVDVFSAAITGFLKTFSDTLQTPDPNIGTTNLKATDWLFFNTAHLGPVVDPVGDNVPKIAATTFDGANGLSWTSIASGAVATWNASHLLAIKNGLWTSLYGNSQFAQLTYLKLTGNYTQNGCLVCGLTCDNTGFDSVQAYALGITGTGVANWQIRRFATGNVVTTLLTGTDTIAAGDVLRFSADQSVAGQVTLTFKQNGTVRGTFVDNAASRITTGCPSITAFVGDTAAGLWESRTFSCGLGL